MGIQDCVGGCDLQTPIVSRKGREEKEREKKKRRAMERTKERGGERERERGGRIYL